MKSTLFKRQEWTMHSGGVSQYKIDCDALSDEDIETLAWLISQKGKFSKVYGVPTGGIRLAEALQKYVTKEGPPLIVDDVLTTGTSMEKAKEELLWYNAVGVVIFARGKYPQWIKPLFEMSWINTEDKMEKDAKEMGF